MAVRLDPYFRAHFAKRRAHKPAQSAIIATARRLLEVVWHVLKENRPYQNRAANRLKSRVAELLGCLCNNLFFGVL